MAVRMDCAQVKVAKKILGLIAAVVLLAINIGDCCYANAQAPSRLTASTQDAMTGLSLANIRARSGGQKPLPKLEMGVGVSSALLDDYPGADQMHYVWLPVPYFIYRGNFLRSDQNGNLRGVFLNSTEIDIDASVAGSFPVNSADDQARQGMPNLDWMGEFGPRVLIHLIHKPRMTVNFSLPVRWVMSTDFTQIDGRGFDFNPELVFSHGLGFDPHGTIVAYYGALWGTSELTRYFYDVAPQYATPSRPAYSAEPGYMYDYVGFTYHHAPSSKSRFLYFCGVDSSFFAGSANRRSPLMRSIQNQSFYAGIIYEFYRSQETDKSGAVIE